jgi:hypothetical protein
MKRSVLTYLSPDEIDRLDGLRRVYVHANAEGISRSAYLRLLILRHLSEITELGLPAAASHAEAPNG